MNHGRDSIYIRIDDDKSAAADDLFNIVDRRFSFVRLGHSFRCTEMEAALGVAELEQHDTNTARRREIAARYDAGLADLAGRLQTPAVRPGAEHAYMFYPLVLSDPALRRDDLIDFLERSGVETRYLLPLINQPVYRDLFGNLDAQYPVAAHLNANAFYIGCHPQISDTEADYVIDVMHDFFNKN